MLGLSTYALFWQYSDRAPQPLGLADMLAFGSRELDGDVFQICDYAPLLGYTPEQLDGVRQNITPIWASRWSLAPRGSSPTTCKPTCALPTASGPR